MHVCYFARHMQAVWFENESWISPTWWRLWKALRDFISIFRCHSTETYCRRRPHAQATPQVRCNLFLLRWANGWPSPLASTITRYIGTYACTPKTPGRLTRLAQGRFIAHRRNLWRPSALNSELDFTHSCSAKSVQLLCLLTGVRSHT